MQTQASAHPQHTHEPVDGIANGRDGGRDRGGGHVGANREPRGQYGSRGGTSHTVQATGGPNQQGSSAQRRPRGGRRHGRGRGGPDRPTQPSPQGPVAQSPQEGRMAVTPGPAATPTPDCTHTGEMMYLCWCKLLIAWGCLITIPRKHAWPQQLISCHSCSVCLAVPVIVINQHVHRPVLLRRQESCDALTMS